MCEGNDHSEALVAAEAVMRAAAAHAAARAEATAVAVALGRGGKYQDVRAGLEARVAADPNPAGIVFASIAALAHTRDGDVNDTTPEPVDAPDAAKQQARVSVCGRREGE